MQVNKNRLAGGEANKIGFTTFSAILEEIDTILNSDKSDFGKCFAISEIVGSSIIKNIDIPGIQVSIPNKIDAVK